ncbi:MAG: hypothetical protein IPM50_00960 [Acidobacteriota bacterium]|nr:MAG: hypothetical protein IPM50_00960 [Acidobacteriota bacterium]
MCVNGSGVLITGEARVGKSECALELLSRGHPIIADDVVLLERRNGQLYGTAPDMFRGLLEIRDLGIIDVRAIFGDESVLDGVQIDLVIELTKDQEIVNDGKLSMCCESLTVEEIPLQKITLRVSRGRNLAVLIETAVKMLSIGYSNAAETLLTDHQRQLNTGIDTKQY